MPQDIQFLYTIQPTRHAMLTEGPTHRESAVVAEHFEYLQLLAREGIVILAGRTLNVDESSFGIVIFRARDDAAARAIMEGDPAVKKRVMVAKLYPYRVALLGRLEE
jgi:uncharacterized protein YciI